MPRSASAVWGCVHALPCAVSSLGGIAVPLRYKVMRIAMCLGWKAPRSPPKADKQGVSVKTRLCYPEEWTWQRRLGPFQQSISCINRAAHQHPPSLYIPLPRPESAASQILQGLVITTGEAATIAFPTWEGNIPTDTTLSGGQTARNPLQLPSLWSQRCQWGAQVQRDSRSLR